MTQTSYSTEPAVGIPGAIAESGGTLVRGVIANGVVYPGHYVQLGSGNSCSHPSGGAPAANVRGGMAVLDPYKQNDGVYADGDIVDVLVEGAMWIQAENTVAEHGAAFVRHTASGAEKLGAIRSDVDGTDAVAIPGLYVRGTGAGVRKLEINKSAA